MRLHRRSVLGLYLIPSLVSMDYVIEASHDCPTINVGTEIVTVDGDHDDAAKVIGALSIDQ